jgi:hypothetical protein
MRAYCITRKEFIMAEKTSFIKVQVIGSKDGKYCGISFEGVNPTSDKYFHCGSIEDASLLKSQIDKFVDEQIMNICPSPWECSSRLTMSQIQQEKCECNDSKSNL